MFHSHELFHIMIFLIATGLWEIIIIISFLKQHSAQLIKKLQRLRFVTDFLNKKVKLNVQHSKV